MRFIVAKIGMLGFVLVGVFVERAFLWIGATMLLASGVNWIKGYFRARETFRSLLQTVQKGSAVFEADEDGFTYQLSENRTRIPWEAVTRSCKTRDFLVLLSGRRLPLVLLPIESLNEEQIAFCEGKNSRALSDQCLSDQSVEDWRP